MNFLWILLGFAPGGLLYLVYLARKKQDKKTKLFKDFWSSLISWAAAGILTFIYSFFTQASDEKLFLFLAVGFISNIISTLLIMDNDKNKKKKTK